MWKKLIAPIVITAVFVLLFLGWLLLSVFVLEELIWMKLIVALIMLSLIGVCLFVLWERIKEIRSGEEDDLDNY